MNGVEIVQDIVEILVAGITELGAGIGSGISEFAQALAFTTTGEGSNATTTLSVFFVLVIVFAGVSLAIGLTRLVFGWLESLGARG